jgi:tetratricopeptide (TPR) repeat protein
MACLDRALFEIGETVGVIERASNAVTLDDAMRAVIRLPTLDACADVSTLTEMLPRSVNPLQRAAADALARETVDLEVALRTGGPKTGVADRTRSVVARARTLGDPELLARALDTLAAIQFEEEAGDKTPETLREAITSASAAHDDRLVAELWTKLLTNLALQKRAHDAETLVPAAEAAVARTATRLDLAVAFLDSKAQIASLVGDVPRAQTLLAEAQRKLDEAGARTAGSPLAPQLLTIRTRTATTYAAADDWPRMVAETRALIPLANAQYGPDHPIVLKIHFNLGVGLRHVRDDEAALAEFREAARIGESRLAASPSLAELLFAVGSTLVQMKRSDEALPYLERAVAMARSTMPANDRRLAGEYNALGSALIDKRRYDEARALFEAQIAIYEHLDQPDDAGMAGALYNLGRIGVESGHCEALPQLERALALYEKIGAKDHSDLDTTHLVIAECQIASGQWAAAVQTSERVLRDPGVDPALHAAVRSAHGRALAGSGHLRDGIAEVRAARKELVDLGESVSDVDAWLAKHPSPRF